MARNKCIIIILILIEQPLIIIKIIYLDTIIRSKLRSVVLTISITVTHNNKTRDKNVNTFINYIHYILKLIDFNVKKKK